MRAKSEIKSTLTSKLTSDIWKKLQNGLLGRELIAFGAEVISENENVKDTMLLQMNPETADRNGLYMLSQMNEIPITNIKPSSLVVRMSGDVKTYAPYELRYNIGNIHFTNIEYTMQGKSVSLINGTHKCYAIGMNTSDDSIEDGSETFFYDGTTTYSGIKLGNAYPDSIVVEYLNDSDVMVEMNRYSPDIALSNVVDIMYKVVTGVDGNIYIRFLKNDDTISTPTTFKIDWLDHSADEFDVEDNEVKDGNDVIATIEYYSQGVIDDLNFMRQQLKKEMAKYNGLNTPISVENYVKGMPYVLDAKCEKGDDGLCVYVKPSSPTQDDYSMYLDFSEVAAHISLNSILFPNIKVKVANQILFGVEISGVNDLKLQQGISSLLQERFSYTNMGFNTIINVGSILSEIYGKYGIVPTINMTIKEPFVNGKPLSFIPIKNSLKLYGVDNSIVAWEESELLYGKVENKSLIPFVDFEVVGSMGTMYLLMYRGNYDDEDNNEVTMSGLSGSGIYGLHERTITYDSTKGYNKFYLYDVNTNTIKPFDGCMQNLIYSDSNPCIKYSSWNTDSQSLGNVFDIKFLSTNNALVVHFVFHNSGAKATGEGEFVDWLINDDNKDLYKKYLGENTILLLKESNNDFKGKYQTTFFIKNPLALKNYNSDSWNVFQDAEHGNPESMSGLYEGLRNITSDNVQLNVKSNWFIYNNKQYYACDIERDYVNITNGAKKLKVSINGSFLGMMPYNNDLYVINEKYTTKVIGFEGLKEKEEIYQNCLDSNTPITITQIIREFDNQIAFKTNDNKFYTATGFEIVGGNKMGFKDLKQIFDDETATSNEIAKGDLGGCTKDYVTVFSKIADQENSVATIGYRFFFYDINTKKTTFYEKSSIVEFPSEISDSITYIKENINLATFWVNNKTVDDVKMQVSEKLSLSGGTTGKLVYRANDSWQVVNENDYDDIIFLKKYVGENDYDFYLMKKNTGEYGDCVQLFIQRGNDTPEPIQDTRTNGAWSYTGYGDNGFDTDFIASFYKICYRLYKKNAFTRKLNFNNNNPKSSESITNSGITTIYDTYQIYDNQNFKPCNSSEILSNWYATGVSDSILYYPAKGEDYYLTDSAMDEQGRVLDNITEDTNVRAGSTVYIWNGSGFSFETLGVYDRCYKLNIVEFKKQTIVAQTNGYNILEQTKEKKLSTIGFYNRETNSCVNDKGTEIDYVKYYSQSPNNTSGSYLKLDVNEIKFV